MRRFVWVSILVIAGNLSSMTGLANACQVPIAPANFPEPSTANAQDMLAAQQAVKHYLSDMESALKCMEAKNDDNARDSAVDDMQKTASKFNSVLHAFRAREKA